MKVLPEERCYLLKRLVTDLEYHILYWDCETSPHEGYFFRTGGNQYISAKQIKKDKETKIITIQFMWEGDVKPSYYVWNKVNGNFDDSEIVDKFVTNVMRKYPQDKLIIIGQNHKAFDHRILNERAKKLRLTPPLHDMIKIDTYKASKQAFMTPSHGLDYRSEQQNLGGKLETNFKMWTDILEGITTPEDKMVPYGLKDVTDLRTILWRELPYYESLPSSLEKLLLKAKAKCVNCENNKKRKYDIEECKVDRKNGWMCINCGNKFTI